MEKTSRITPRSKDFSQWYQDVIAAADLAEHSGIKGAMIIKSHGYGVWERIQEVLNKKIKETGHRNAYFPLLIPESYLTKEKEHVEGFSPELAVVTHAGGEKLDEPLVVRPTSETVINAAFSRWIESWRDLPLLINQWANVVRWELRPRLFLRTTEFLWQEGHTAHATEAEAEEEAKRMLGVYQDLAENYLAVPVISGEKTENEKFAGALRSYSIEAMMQDGKALQAGTSHNLGQNFATAFDVMFTDKDGQRKHVWQTSWGVSTRLMGALIMVHSDDDGLVLPPRVASVEVVLVTLGKTDEEKQKVAVVASRLVQELQAAGVITHLDDRDNYSPGYKFNEWEKKGIPVRIEIGPRDILANQVVVVRRDTKEKQVLSIDQVAEQMKPLLETIQQSLLDRARVFMDAHTVRAESFDVFTKSIDEGNFVFAPWCGSAECEKAIHEQTKATIRCIPFEQPKSLDQSCVHCTMKATSIALFARAY